MSRLQTVRPKISRHAVNRSRLGKLAVETWKVGTFPRGRSGSPRGACALMGRSRRSRRLGRMVRNSRDPPIREGQRTINEMSERRPIPARDNLLLPILQFAEARVV